MVNFQLVLWAVLPPLLLLAYYYRRIRVGAIHELPLPMPQVLLFFVVGVVSGLAALGFGWGFESLASWFVDWELITRSLPGVALRQLVEVGPIEEGSKLGSFLLFQSLKRPKGPSPVFLATIAVALGFTAEENWVYLSNETASILDRLIGTPVHIMFSAPWGYALGVVSCSTLRPSAYREVIVRAWLTAVACHALVNIFSIAWRYPEPLRFLSYGLFPFLIWLFWRLEGLVRRVESKPPIALITGRTRLHRHWQLGLALFALFIGGNAIFGLFLLVKRLSFLSSSQLVYGFLLNLTFGLLAWAIYRYLRYLASKRI